MGLGIVRVGWDASTMREICKAHGLIPHHLRQFKLSNDRAFEGKTARCGRADCGNVGRQLIQGVQHLGHAKGVA